MSGRFLPALFRVEPETLRSFRGLLALPVKFGGVGIPDPTCEGQRRYEVSREATAHLTGSLAPDGGGFDLRGHVASAMAARQSGRAVATASHDAALGSILKEVEGAQGGDYVVRRVQRSRECGAWLTVLPLTWGGTGLEADEFRDALRIRYGFVPDGMVDRCDGDGCGQP